MNKPDKPLIGKAQGYAYSGTNRLSVEKIKPGGALMNQYPCRQIGCKPSIQMSTLKVV